VQRPRRITLAEAHARFGSERNLVEAGVAGVITATSQQGEITQNDWASLLVADDHWLRLVINWNGCAISLEPLSTNHKTGVLIEFLPRGSSDRNKGRKQGDTDRARAELLCKAARPSLPGSLAWSADRARREALAIEAIKNDPLLNVSRSRNAKAWKLAKEMLSES
jgi:hypothetical protein